MGDQSMSTDENTIENATSDEGGADEGKRDWTVKNPGSYNSKRYDVIGYVDIEHSRYRSQEITGEYELVKDFTPFVNGPRGGYKGTIKVQNEDGNFKVRVRDKLDGYSMITKDETDTDTAEAPAEEPQSQEASEQTEDA